MDVLRVGQTTEPVAGAYDSAKRVIDLFLATMIAALVSPILLFFALAILLDDGGPVIFFQDRVGKDGHVFRLCKFRSMHRHASDTPHRLHVVEAVAKGAELRIGLDPRVTRVGRIIRKWSIDELPNLWNVIRGDMSMVGPRPLVPYEAATINGDAARRFSVRPGVTGLAQVSGRLEMTHEQRLDLDLAYALNRSLWRDLVIIVQTIPSIVRSRG